MTRVRWTLDAADDLAQIVARIHQDNPSAANRVAKTIFEAVASLRSSPNRGRPGLVNGTRELVFAPWPYIVVYEVIEDQAHILRIRHASQSWP